MTDLSASFVDTVADNPYSYRKIKRLSKMPLYRTRFTYIDKLICRHPKSSPMLEYTAKVANGVHSPLFRQSSNPCIQINKKDQEAFAGLLADLNITSDQIITLPNILNVLHNDICEIHLTSFGFQDKALPTFMIKALFEETISEEFQDYFIIVTDASKSHTYTSIAGTSNLEKENGGLSRSVPFFFS
ncbi:hypothetical protein AVEN_206565-1 [Araneus ventricosus]|uniref:Uncharacterized protein n=1 Tax=Araneus ventricosus TaxID=182803 RepID=A0A4Y1ZL69_ARAVE|nr:hypothetical protein AVEN_206565-1 [Araneus ventricosus]